MAPLSKVVFVHLKDSENHNRQAEFCQPLVKSLNGSDTQLWALASVKMKDDTVLITPDTNGVRIERPAFCPIHNLTIDQKKQMDATIINRGVNCGVVILLESADNKVILTKRSLQMRTFPGIWTIPGGHIETGEQLHEAGLRELLEETGLKVTLDMCVKEPCLLGFWESTYPAMLSAGLPKRHHLVIYYHVSLKHPFTAESMNLIPDETEVAKCVWLTKKEVQKVLSADKLEVDSYTFSENLRCLNIDKGKLQWEDLPLTSLCHKYTGEKSISEHVSTGTKFALSQWLQLSDENYRS